MSSEFLSEDPTRQAILATFAVHLTNYAPYSAIKLEEKGIGKNVEFEVRWLVKEKALSLSGQIDFWMLFGPDAGRGQDAICQWLAHRINGYSIQGN